MAVKYHRKAVLMGNQTDTINEHQLTDEDQQLIREVALKRGFRDVRFEDDKVILVHADGSEKPVLARDFSLIMGK